MSDEKSIVPVQDAAPSLWGEREEVAAIAKRLRTMLPNGDKLTEGQVYAAAQYAKLTSLDPFSGGFYAVENGGITDGYKTLVAWAQSKENYNDKYFPLSETEIEVEGYERENVVEAWCCYLIRRSQQPLLVQLLSAGLDVRDALDLIGHRGVGVVVKADLVTKKGTAKEPPKTKTWAWVARKRALRAAIAVGYGQPTLAELAALGERARAEGWADVPADAIARAVALSEQARQIIEASASLSPGEHQERLARNVEVLRGRDEGPIGEEPEPTPEERFCQQVCIQIPYYRHANHVKNTLAKLVLIHDPANEDMLLDALDMYARQRANEKAQPEQTTMFEPEPQPEPAGPGAAYTETSS